MPPTLLIQLGSPRTLGPEERGSQAVPWTAAWLTAQRGICHWFAFSRNSSPGEVLVPRSICITSSTPWICSVLLLARSPHRMQLCGSSRSMVDQFPLFLSFTASAPSTSQSLFSSINCMVSCRLTPLAGSSRASHPISRPPASLTSAITH